ncbi:MAG: hypothetical protein JEY99_05500 [Spirochaetales bacterium]|nr:hypothetical protein [Spirochaetales bacterium]
MKPKKVIKTNTADGYEYSYRWGGFFNIFGTTFAGVFLCSVSYSLYTSRDNIAALLFGSIFLIVIAVVFYAQICWLINTSRFHLTRTSLQITTYPFPWPKSAKFIQTGDIIRVYTQKFRGRRGMVLSTVIIRKDGSHEVVFSKWNNIDDPLYFQSELKGFLNITESVEGELAK